MREALAATSGTARQAVAPVGPQPEALEFTGLFGSLGLFPEFPVPTCHVGMAQPEPNAGPLELE